MNLPAITYYEYLAEEGRIQMLTEFTRCSLCHEPHDNHEIHRLYCRHFLRGDREVTKLWHKNHYLPYP